MTQSIYALYAIAMLVILPHIKLFSQKIILTDSLTSIDTRFIKSLSKKSAELEQKVNLRTDRYLRLIAKEEKRVQKLIRQKDHIAAAAIFGDIDHRYKSLRDQLNTLPENPPLYVSGHLDSLTTALKFLNNFSAAMGNEGEVAAGLHNLEGLQRKYLQVENIRRAIESRQQYLQSGLAGFGMLKELKKMQRKVRGFRDDVARYQAIINAPGAIESKTLEVLQKLPAFQDFVRKHSRFGSVFLATEDRNYSNGDLLPGLQTRFGNEQLLKERYGSETIVHRFQTNPGSSSSLALPGLKQFLPLSKQGTSIHDLSDFKPDNQKTRSWKKRFVIGSDLQTVKANYFFPSTTDIALSLGYKINSKSIVGLGGSYRLGMEKQARHIRLSHQGMGLRSFIDYSIKSNFFLSGGAEFNYRSQFKDFEILRNYSGWQRSVLFGVSRKQKLGGKLEANARLSYDFLWKCQIPRTQPLIFRIGYALN